MQENFTYRAISRELLAPLRFGLAETMRYNIAHRMENKVYWIETKTINLLDLRQTNRFWHEKSSIVDLYATPHRRGYHLFHG